MRSLYLASVFVHLVAAAAWIGGMLAVAAVLVPVLRRLEDRGLAVRLMHESGLRLRAVGWLALGLLLASGVLQLGLRLGGVGPLGDARFWGSGWGHLLALKLALVLAVLALAAAHDFRVGPRAGEAALRDPGGAAAARLRRTASWMGRALLGLSLAIVALGVLLVRGGP